MALYCFNCDHNMKDSNKRLKNKGHTFYINSKQIKKVMDIVEWHPVFHKGKGNHVICSKCQSLNTVK